MDGCAVSALFPAHYGVHRVAATPHFSECRLRARGRSCRALALAECHNYRNYIVYGNEILVADIGQIVISLFDTYRITNNRDYLQKAFDLLSPLTASNNLLQLWDPAHLGYFEDVLFKGTAPQNPGTMQVANGKKDGGRMMEMLWAFHLADQYGGNYQNMENALLTIALNKVYYAPGHGVIYEMRPDWSLVTIKGIPEDWVTTEAMGIELESLFALN